MNGQERNYNGSIGGTACSPAVPNISPVDFEVTCKGIPVLFSTTECVDCTYQWYKNDNIIVGATNSTYSTTKPAYYNVGVTQSNGCVAYSDYTLLNVGLNPNANIYHPNGLNLCAPSPGTNIIVKVGYTESNTYVWYKDGLPYEGEGADSWRIFPSEPGEYRCSITSIDGCNRVTNIATVIDACRIAESDNNELSLYPNPVSNVLNINLNLNNSTSTSELYIVSVLGEVIHFETVTLMNGLLNTSINTEKMPAGIYLVKVIADGNEFTQQIVINN